ncbi:MAG: hypothetical protein OXG61_04495 [Chloroflexi bacterium]|nr:hypothetical protein [Chloroflexota bacterium]
MSERERRRRHYTLEVACGQRGSLDNVRRTTVPYWRDGSDDDWGGPAVTGNEGMMCGAALPRSKVYSDEDNLRADRRRLSDG